MSHPSWVCGLKREKVGKPILVNRSHPSWVCGLKPCVGGVCKLTPLVTPFVGVWIETNEVAKDDKAVISHTLRGCVD